MLQDFRAGLLEGREREEGEGERMEKRGGRRTLPTSDPPNHPCSRTELANLSLSNVYWFFQTVSSLIKNPLATALCILLLSWQNIFLV